MGCKNCGGKTEGYKCDMCGAIATGHVESHSCGGKHCMPMCTGCRQAEVLCKC